MLRRRSKLIDSKEELINACAYKSFESNPYYENSEHYENQKKEYFKELEENDKEYRKVMIIKMNKNIVKMNQKKNVQRLNLAIILKNSVIY